MNYQSNYLLSWIWMPNFVAWAWMFSYSLVFHVTPRILVFQITYFFWEDKTVWLYPLKLWLFFGVICYFWHLMGNSVCCVVDSTIVFSSRNMMLGVYRPISDCMALGSEFRICHTWCLHSETLFQVISKFFIGWSAIK